MARAYVYIDGFNLYYGALKRTPFKWLDLGKLCHVMLPNDAIESIQYFTARVSARPHNTSAPLDQQVYLRALRTVPNLSISFGHFLTHSVRMVLSGSNPPQRVFVDKTEEKGSDVNLASHLLRDGFMKRFDLAVLVTNDSDLAEPVRIVRHELGLPVGILNPHQVHSNVLKNLATFSKTHPSSRPDRQPAPADHDRWQGHISEAGGVVISDCKTTKPSRRRWTCLSTRSARTAATACDSFLELPIGSCARPRREQSRRSTVENPVQSIEKT